MKERKNINEKFHYSKKLREHIAAMHEKTIYENTYIEPKENHQSNSSGKSNYEQIIDPLKTENVQTTELKSELVESDPLDLLDDHSVQIKQESAS